MNLADLDLGPEWPEDLRPGIAAAIAASGERLVVLDDDPTGTQTVHDVDVVTTWDVATLRDALAEDRVFFVLTNSRSLAEPEAVALASELGANLAATAAGTTAAGTTAAGTTAAGTTAAGHSPTAAAGHAAAAGPFAGRLRIASRSDSTLRGHFPAEVDALIAGLGREVDGVILAPAFPDGGRITVADVHWVDRGGVLTPVADTEFAADASFGYTASALPAWVEEKTHGAVPAADVLSVPLAVIRGEGPDGVARLLMGAVHRRIVVVNAVTYRDLDVVAAGVQRAEARGRYFVYRCAAGFVRARSAMSERPLLTRAEVVDRPGPGLVVCGSHVPTSTAQLAVALRRADVVGIELAVADIGAGPEAANRAVAIAAAAADRALATGRHALVFTSRRVLRVEGIDPLTTSRNVSDAVVAVVRATRGSPAFVVGKGGITSSDIATGGLDIRRARVLGQLLPGVAVWRARPGQGTDVPLVVFPGNVGDDGALAEVLTRLSPPADGGETSRG